MFDSTPTDRTDLGFGVNEFRRIDLAAALGPRGSADVAVLAYPGAQQIDEPKSRQSARPEKFELGPDVGPSAELLPSNAAPSHGSVFPAARHLLTAAPLVAADLLALIDSAVFGLMALFALRALHLVTLPAGGPTELPLLCALVQLPLVLAYAWRGLYPGIGLHPAAELRQVAEVNTTACLCVTTALLAAGAAPAWAAFSAATCLASFVLVPLARSLARAQCARRHWWGCPAVVISCGDAARETTRALLARPQSGLRPVAVLDPTGRGGRSVLGVPCLEEAADVTDGATGGAPLASYAVMALPELPAAETRELLDKYRSRFPRLLVLSGAGAPRDPGGALAGTELRNAVLLPWPRFVKRATDVALTATALALGLPLMIGVAVAVRLSSPGPIFFGHRRLGRGGLTFKAWKFRTMRTDADKVLRELLASDPAARREWDLDHKLRNDPRVTRIGNFLRKTSLDELPQLWNVLKGDMSLVGPRPIVKDEIVKYGDVYRLYSQVPPGITGLWQVSGRNNTTYGERVGLDDYYVRNWSPWLDLHVLARTVVVLITGYGAY